MDAKKIEVRNKLRRIIREMLFPEPESDPSIPPEICEGILENYGWTPVDQSNHPKNINNFVTTLLKWIEHTPQDTHKKMVECGSNSLSDAYLEAESEYYQVTSDLINILVEAVQHKEKYCANFKSKCKSQEKKMNMLIVKSQFLKLQFFLRLYGEENALRGHLKLRSKLRNELETLKENYKNLIELNKQYSSLKCDKNYTQLFKTYKELKKIEKRTEIVGKM